MPMTASLTEGSVSRTLLGLIGPMIVGVISIMSMNLIDTFFVAGLGTQALAAIGLTFPVVTLVGTAIMGLGVGASSVISRASGAGELERVRVLATDSLLLGGTVVATLMLLGLATIDPLFRALGATAETLPLARQYMLVWYGGVLFLVAPMLGNSSLRALGDTFTPALIMGASAVVDVILDPILIFGFGPIPAMGMYGAALATILARAVGFVLVLFVLHRRGLLELSTPKPARLLASWREILSVGGPAAGANMVVPLSVGIVTGMIARYGDAAVAGYAAASRIESLAMIVPMSIGASMGPFVGQNWGARRHDRIDESLRLADHLVVAWGVGSILIFALFSAPLGSFFSDDTEVLAVIEQYLAVAPWGHSALGLFLVGTAAFNAAGRSRRAALLTLLRAPLLLVGFAFVGGSLFGLLGVFVGVVVSNVAVGILTGLQARGLSEGEERLSLEPAE